MPDRSSSPPTNVIEWKRQPARRLREPLVVDLPHVELALEHPDVEPTAFGDSFFPDGVPYTLDGERRTFYWRRVLTPGGADPDTWLGLCATTHELAPIPFERAHVPTLCEPVGGEGQVAVVVDGTVAGDSTTALVRDYDPPTVSIADVDDDAVTVTTGSRRTVVEAETRAQVPLRTRRVTLERDGSPARVTPRLTVRYPGRRTVYHPDPAANYRLFPSFGLDLDAVAVSVTVPTSYGELEPTALATTLGVDLAERPYPERVLWRAFAFEAFDPHRGEPPRIAQFPSGLLAVERYSSDGGDDSAR